MEHFYPPVIQYGLRTGEKICRRIGQVMVALGFDKRLWLNALKRVARKVDPNDENTIRFSENGILPLFQYFRTFFKESNITGLRFQIPDDFGCGLYQLYLWLMKTPTDLTGKEFGIHARCLFGFQFVQIFGTQSVTATIKQISVYTGYCLDKAKEDGVLCGQPLSLRNFSDTLMETVHKSTKMGSMSYSCGKKGPCTGQEYQESILAQQMANCTLHQKRGCISNFVNNKGQAPPIQRGVQKSFHSKKNSLLVG